MKKTVDNVSDTAHIAPMTDRAVSDETPETLRKAFGAELRTRRQNAGLSLADAASKLGLHTRTIDRWEFGQTRPTKAELIALDVIYGTLQDRTSRVSRAARKSNNPHK